MKYDFTSIPDRRGYGSNKWEAMPDASPDRVPLSVADMEFNTAPPIKEALKKLVDDAVLGYTHPTDTYYDAVIGWMKRRHGFDVKKEWIIQTPGVVDALGLLIEVTSKPCEGVIILTPVYYPFDMAVLAKDRKIVYSILINNNGHYEIDYADLEEKAKDKNNTALLFCNPHNPIGRVWTREELKRVVDICSANGVFIIDDEIHNDLIMPGNEHTVMSTVSEKAQEICAVCTAPSKTFNLAGVQCSNIIIPNEKIRLKASACALLNMHMGLNIFSYTACTAAYNECEDWLEELISVIHGNAKYVENFMAENFPEIKVIDLEGTYLQWWDLRDTGLNHREQRLMLEKAGLYLDNGELFGKAGRGFQRINLACCRETLEKSMERFKVALNSVYKEWEENGAPVHTTLCVGDSLTDFTYDSPYGKGRLLKNSLTKSTLLVFARYFECDICQEMLKTFKKYYPAFKLLGMDVKVVMQSPLETLEKAQKDYPFELIADPKAVLYDRYNVFEADGAVAMVAGDKMFEEMSKCNVKALLDSDMIAGLLASALDSSDSSAEGPRGMQLSAFFGVDRSARVTYAHYCRTMGDIPEAMDMIKGVKGGNKK